MRSRSEASGIPDIDAYIAFCRLAERCGFEYLLTACGFHRPDALIMAAALGMVTQRIKFLVAVRSGLFSPTVFAQQVNTISVLTGGRVGLNVVNGHSEREQRYYGDFLDHDERYDRTDEFLGVCRALWARSGPVTHCGRYFHIEDAVLNTPFSSADRSEPELYIGGASPLAVEQACRHDACLLTMPAPPDELARRLAPLRRHGGRAGLIVAVIARATTAAAMAAADELVRSAGGGARAAHRSFRAQASSVAFAAAYDQSVETAWLSPSLWAGAVPFLGPSATALLGSYDDVARALLGFRDDGITEFLFLGWPDVDEMERFASEVAPRVREQEAELC